uniref:F-box protein At4g38870 isoform X2 n=1 Tax=Nicotiana sylvestris TaxID=4096 RepID=A0A1U7XXD6_NICSY|nr:PREDICTED: putative F-box protein At4g38870 isoform X2 [Nicotiana sylvestris]
MAKKMACIAAQLLLEGLPEAMVLEVLLWLPLKPLYQCKCVSKAWCSTISDPEFMKLHHVRNLGIVISTVSLGSLWSRLLQARLCLEEKSIGWEGESPFIERIDYECGEDKPIKFTQVINGLLCFCTPSLGLSICNLYTGETIELPLPQFYCNNGSTRFHFGFDPISGSYKLLSLSYCNNRLPLVIAEILTIGADMTNSSWNRVRSIQVNLELLPPQSVCIDGILYWYVSTRFLGKEMEVSISAFYLNEIKFGNIFLITVEPVRLMQFNGCLAVGCLDSDTTKPWKLRELKLWELKDVQCSRWINHSMTLPEELVRCNRESWCSFGNLPTGEILLANPKANNSYIPIYSYDQSVGKFQRFVIGKSPGMVSPECFQISCLEVYNNDSLEALLCKPPTDVIHRFKRRLLTHVIVMDSSMDPAMSSDDQQDVNAIEPGAMVGHITEGGNGTKEYQFVI